MHIRLFLGIAIVIAAGLVCSRGLSQGFGAYDPSRDLMSQITAQSEIVHTNIDFMRASGQLAQQMAQVRQMHAQARSAEAKARLDEKTADLFDAESYWYLRDLWERETLRRRGTPLNNQKKKNQATWELLKAHPELVGRAVPEGRALNFLMHRLSGTLLAYHFNGNEPAIQQEQLDSLRLDNRLLHALQLKQPGQGSEQRAFRADGTGGLEGRWWPYFLRFEEFTNARRAFEDARESVVAQADRGYEVDIKGLQKLDAALTDLSSEFYKRFPPGTAAKAGVDKFVQFRAAESFLRDLDRQVKRIQSTGDVRGLRPQFYDPKAAGKDLPSLLTYMSRNGTEFAPAEPGDEETYSQVFVMMRDLFVQVADDDPGIKPKDIDQLIQEKLGEAKERPQPYGGGGGKNGGKAAQKEPPQ